MCEYVPSGRVLCRDTNTSLKHMDKHEELYITSLVYYMTYPNILNL